LIFGGWILQVGIRLGFAAHRASPFYLPDEAGYLLAARLLAGGAGGDLSGPHGLYQGGYPVLISPAFWLSDDPATVYRLVIAINSLVGASLLVLAYVALRRLSLPRTQAYVLATVTALLPSGIYYGELALTEAILPVVVLGWLLLVHSWLTSGRLGYGVAASAVAAYSYCVHARGTIIVMVHAGLLVAVLWRSWAKKRDIAVMASVLVSGSAAGWALNGWVRSQLYPGGVTALGDVLFSRLTSVDGLGWTLALAAGKIWYLIVSTWGVAGVGLLAVGVLAVRRGTPYAIRAMACMTLATLVGIALGTSAATPDERSVANFAYGRYLSCLAPVLFLAGAAFAARTTRRTAVWAGLATADLTLVTGCITWLYAGDRLSRKFSVWDFPEICFLTWNWRSLELWTATWVALLLLLLALGGLVIANGRRSGLLIVAVAFIALDLAVMTVITKRVTRYWARGLETAASLSPAGLRAQDHVAIDHGLSWRIRFPQTFQVRTGLKPINRYRRETLPPDTTLVVVPWGYRLLPRDSWPAAPANWQPVWRRRTNAGNWVAWRRAG
jgi:hypothetical protein